MGKFVNLSFYKYCILVAIFHFFTGTFIFSQQLPLGLPNIRNFKKEIYKAGTQNWCIDQSSKGIVYFANNDGLLEFDGINWRVYPLPNGSHVRVVAVDDQDRIWVGGTNEIGYFSSGKNGLLEFHSITSLVPAEFKEFDEVWKIHITKNGLFFQSFKGLFYYDYNKVKLIENIGDYHFSFYVNQRLFIQDNKLGLLELRGRNLYKIEGSVIFTNGVEVWGMTPLNEKDILISTQQNGLYIYDGYSIKKYNSNLNEVLIKNQIFSVQRIHDRIIWGTIQDGIYISDLKGRIILHLNKYKGLQNNTVLYLYLDKNLQLWAGLDNGIDFIELNSPFSYYSDIVKVNGAGYNSLLYRDTLYLATNQGLFYARYSGTNTDFKIVKYTKGQVWTLVNVDNQIFCGHNKGTFLIKNNKAKLVSNISGAWKFLRFEHYKNKLIGGTYTGLILFQRDKKNQWKFKKKIKGFDYSCRVMETDSNNTLWVCHEYKGVYKIVLSNSLDSIVSIQKYGKKNGLPSDYENYVYRFDNKLIFTTKDGIYRYNSRLNRFEPYSYFDNIFGKKNVIRAPQIDDFGNIAFFSGNNFIYLRKTEKGKYKKYQDLFSRFSGNYIKSFKNFNFSIKNRIIINTDFGFVLYKTNFTDTSNNHGWTLIRQVDIGDVSYSTIFYGSVENTKQTKLYEIPYSQNSIKFSFSVTNFAKQNQNFYRYKLLGISSKWSPWQESNVVQFNNLANGKYRFIVQAKSSSGYLCKPDSFDFVVLTPWYKSTYAIFVYILFILIVLASVYYYLNNLFQKQKDHLNEQKNRELSLQEKYYTKKALMAQQQIIQLKNEKLTVEIAKKKSDIELKNKELVTSAVLLTHKNEILKSLKSKLIGVKSKVNHQAKLEISQLIRTIDNDVKLDEDWTKFKKHFEEVHSGFFSKLKKQYPNLTPKDLKMCAYLKMNLTTKEIAPLLNISVRGVEISRYRLRKKLNLPRNKNISEFLLEFIEN